MGKIGQNAREHFAPPTMGPLMGGPHCRLSIFRKWQCPLSLFFLDFPVDFRIVECPLSILRYGNVPSHYVSKFSVDFKTV